MEKFKTLIWTVQNSALLSQIIGNSWNNKQLQEGTVILD
jgi:hypothetical protein